MARTRLFESRQRGQKLARVLLMYSRIPPASLRTVMSTPISRPQSSSDRYQTRAQSMIGQLLGGKWLVLRVLGVGGMATVFQAMHQRNQKIVAIKTLHPELAALEEVRERFLAEGVTSNLVVHAGSIQVFDDGTLDTGEPFLVMDYLDGETLESLWQKQKDQLGLPFVLRVAREILEVLSFAHARGVIHRDIKPENIFITRTGETKLLDFGIARAEGVSRAFVTQCGATMGTPAYMPPEQARGRWEDLDERADIFSLSASLYALLSGRAIHQAETGNELLLAAMSQPVAPLKEVSPTVPECIAEIVDRGLCFNKEDRYASAKQMQVAVRRAEIALQQAAEGEGIAWEEPAPWTVVPTEWMNSASEMSTRAEVSIVAPGRHRVPMLLSVALVTASVVAAFQLTPDLLSSLRRASTVATETVLPTAEQWKDDASAWVTKASGSIRSFHEAMVKEKSNPSLKEDVDEGETVVVEVSRR